MADNLQFFDVEQGLGIDENVNIIAVSGAPGGSAPADTVPKGSFAMDFGSTPAKIYWKFATGSGTDKWKEVGEANAIPTDISWREPVLAHEDGVIAIPTGITWPDTRDTISINPGDRVLFSNTTDPGGHNVYIATGTSPNGTYTEDTNDESQGDRLYVLDGDPSPVGRKTYAGTIWTYNKSNQWVLSEKATDEVELSYIRNYIGKTDLGDKSGTEPIYGSNNYVTDGSAAGDDLAQAIGVLDAGIGPKVPAGTYNAILPSTTNDVNDNIEALDDAIGDIGGQSSLVAGTGSRVLDTVDAYDVAVVRWIVFAFDGTTRRSWTVTATHDGTPPATPAANTDRAVRARLRLNTPFSDAVSVSVALGGAPVGSEIDLVVDSNTASVAWRAVRTVVKW